MTSAQFLVLGLVVLALCVIAFVVIARKGRELKTKQPLPPAAKRAILESKQDGKRVEITSPFYLGRSQESHVVLPSARAEFEVCIFFHHNRFAFQTLEGGGEVRVNGQEMPAGYLWDGDRIEIAGQEFLLRVTYS